jgi:hypothetical protein
MDSSAFIVEGRFGNNAVGMGIELEMSIRVAEVPEKNPVREAGLYRERAGR